MVTRNLMNVDDNLYSQLLNCYPHENQAAKIYAQWLKDHPDEKISDVNMRIDTYEREEDHYGNGGGYDRYVRIYKTRKETQEEYDARIKKEETFYLAEFEVNVRKNLSDLIRELNIYPNRVSQEITDKQNEIMGAINDIVRKCLNKKEG